MRRMAAVFFSRDAGFYIRNHVWPSRQDSGIVVESFKSGFDPPGDFPFEDFSQNLSRTGSDGAISSTPKGERDAAPGPRPDPKHTMSKAKNKLWLFGKKPKVRGCSLASCRERSLDDLRLHFKLEVVISTRSTKCIFCSVDIS